MCIFTGIHHNHHYDATFDKLQRITILTHGSWVACHCAACATRYHTWIVFWEYTFICWCKYSVHSIDRDGDLSFMKLTKKTIEQWMDVIPQTELSIQLTYSTMLGAQHTVVVLAWKRWCFSKRHSSTNNNKWRRPGTPISSWAYYASLYCVWIMQDPNCQSSRDEGQSGMRLRRGAASPLPTN